MRRMATMMLVLLSSAQCRSGQNAPADASPAPGRASAETRTPARAGGAARQPEPAGARPSAGSDPVPRYAAVRARELARRLIILDGHIDVPYRLEQSRDANGNITEDISQRTAKGDFDWPRAKLGGLDVPFMSIYVPAKYEQGGARELANRLIRMVEGFAEKWPDKFGLARSPSDVRKNTEAGKISLAMGMENGAPLGGKLENVAYFHGRGIRYITLTHSKDNHIADSSTDSRRTHKGLSEFGKKVVAEMNRVGTMVDVSHASDAAFYQVLEISRVPVIASHSSCRHFAPDWPRNLSDDMIRALAKNGGVIQVNFGSRFIGSYDPRPPKRYATVEQVADHIDHIVKLAGVEHVGLGSDFDGVGDSLPAGLKDVSEYPNLIRVLLERGYSEADIEKICSGNALRVWQAAEDYARGAARAEN